MQLSRRRGYGLLGLGIALEAGLLGLPGLGDLTQNAPTYVWLMLGLFVLFGFGCAVALWPGRSLQNRELLLIILFFAALFRFTAIWVAPTLSTDQFRYTWEGHLVLEGVSPYQYAPNDPALIPYHSPIWPLVQQSASTSPYPPLSQLIAATEYLLGRDSLLGPKIAAAFFDFLNCLALVWLLGVLKLDRRKVIFYAWCPLPVIEFGQSGHNDAPMLLLLLVSVGLAVKQRPLASAVVLGLASLAKFTALFGLPLFLSLWAASWLRGRKAGRWAGLLHLPAWPYALVTLGVVVLGYLPFLVIGKGALGSLLEYSSSWSDNESVAVNWVMDTFGSLPAKLLSLAVLGTVVGLLSFQPWLVRHLSLARRLTLVLGTTLLVATTVHTWYVSWILVLLPLVIGEDAGWGWDFAWLLFAALAQLPYLTYKFYGQTPLYQWIRPLEYWPVLLLAAGNALFLLQRQYNRRQRQARPLSLETSGPTPPGLNPVEIEK